jgi:hydrophobe/amphiphile efflux-3 (HAE3) family protein
MLARRPAAFLGIAVLLTAILSMGLTGAPALGISPLRVDASVDLLANQASPAWADQVLFANTFGADPVVVMVEAPAGVDLMTGTHFIGLAALEGDLACKIRANNTGCDPRPGVKKVYGPGTVVNTLALEVTKRGLEICATQAKAAEDKAISDAQAAGKSAQDAQTAGSAAFDAAARACADQLAAQYPGLGLPAINNPAFIREVLLQPDGATRTYWRWAMPDSRHALIQVRMDPHASLSDVRDLLQVVRKHEAKPKPAAPQTGQAAPAAGAAATPSDGITPDGDLSDLKFYVTGSPVLALSLADSVESSLLALLPAALIAMLLVTVFILRLPLRLLAVPIAALAAYWTAGAAGIARLPVTPATLAVLPVVLGLATDYTLQAVNRLADEDSGGPSGRITRAARAILPPTGIAALATVAGILAFAFSPLPLVRQFALFLAIGVGCAYLAAVLVGIPLFAVVLSSDLRRYLARPAARPRWTVLERAGRLPLAVVVPLVLVGFAGWAALPFVRIETDPARMMPANDPAVRQAEHIRDAVGVAGELDLVVSGPAVSNAAVVNWVATIDQRAGGDLKAEDSLASFLSAFNNGKVPDQALIDRVLQAMPDYFTGAVMSKDKTIARAAFGVNRLSSVDEDAADVQRLRAMPAPPAGYRAFPAGLAVVAADALTEVRRDALPLNLGALGLVLVVLLVTFRRLRPALVAVTPTAVAAGWATGLMWATHAAANPVTVLLAGVVVAFATEFSVLWLARYSAERRGGAAAAAAAAVASGRVGPAIVASALALAVGFLALALSPVPVVRDFGLWSGADILLATAAVLVLLPPLARRVVA